MAEKPLPELIPDDIKKVIKETYFKGLLDEVPIEIYTLPGMNDKYNEATISLLSSLAGLSEKIRLSLHTVGDAQAMKRKVTRSPTVLIAPDKYGMRYTGAPLGEESKTLLLAILMASTGRTMLSDEAVLKIRDKVKDRRDIQIFVSPTCPYCPQQVLTAFSAAIAQPGRITAEAIEIYENQDLAERLGTLTVPQTIINNIFTGAGLQPEPLFLESLITLKEPQQMTAGVAGATIEKDMVIVGGGPAGLTAAIYAARAGLSCVVIEKNTLGGQVAITPVVENYPGFTSIGGKSLMDLITQQAVQYAEIHVGESILDAKRDPHDGRIYLKTTAAIYIAKSLVIATGASSKLLDANGVRTFTGKGVSSCATCDGYYFKDGKQVIVVGGGNTALTDALYLHNLGAKVTLVHWQDALRAEARLQESFRLSGIPVLWNHELREVIGDRVVRNVRIEDKKAGTTVEMKVDGVFIAIGYTPNNEVAKQLGLELDAQGYVKTDLATMRTSMPLVYAAGDLTGAPKQIVVAVSHGSIAAMTAFDDLSALAPTKPAAIGSL